MLKQISGDQMNITDTTYCYLNFCIIDLIDLQNILPKKLTNTNDNDFTVTSLQKIGTKEYKVTKERKAVLTNNNRFLSCECAHCKHMFAIFKNIDSLLCAYYFLGSASKTDHHFCKLVLGPHFHKLEYG